ncbi:hypothetical protein FHS43_000590 [Streptosporangium becharense]|uniref:Uncharacterized protein n=1 Tax=Streptosporangium becharense TaxID=1816182 RepID=A0A7W9MKM3_9ACTN|nr:hypothetical protein [Streptosporangium becharense]MBB2909344.1 hypothetical protein [Streptosporangium becharense]MBB5823753.1 hypothetical protein [Streptosporangium becharense]
MTLTQDRAAELRALYPPWVIWQSDIGRWWAMRGGGLSLALRDRGAVATVDADDLESLTDLITTQEQIRREAS